MKKSKNLGFVERIKITNDPEVHKALQEHY